MLGFPMMKKSFFLDLLRAQTHITSLYKLSSPQASCLTRIGFSDTVHHVRLGHSLKALVNVHHVPQVFYILIKRTVKIADSQYVVVSLRGNFVFCYFKWKLVTCYHQSQHEGKRKLIRIRGTLRGSRKI